MKSPSTIARAALSIAFVCSVSCSTDSRGPGQRAYTLVFLETGPKSGQLSPSENRQAFEGHFANMGRLAEEHKLVLAGPFGERRHAESLRGLFVLDTSQRSEAIAWASSDPTAQAGIFTLEYHDFATDAPLVAALDRDLERRRQAEREGRTLSPGDGARPYVLLIADDLEKARRELSPLLSGGGVFLLARLDTSRLLAILDAQNVADAEKRYGATFARLGAHTLDDWFASAQLANLHGH
jgi:uncharacterized protein YciI